MTEEEELQRIDQLTKQKRKRWLIVMITLLAIILGGTTFMIEKHNEQKQQERDYMIKVVKSDEAKKIFEASLKNIDPNAFTDKGFIKTYSIDYKTLSHNPMGGINVILFINSIKQYDVEIILDKYSGALEEGSMSISPELVKLKNKQ